MRDAANTGRRTATVNLQAEKRTQPHPLFVLIWRSPVPMFLKRPGISSWKPQRSARSNDETPTKMSSNTACGIDTRARKRKRHDGDTQEAIPGLLDDIVVTHVLRSENLDDPAELARLRVVSRGMRNAVAATGRRFVEMDVFHAVKFGCFGTLKRLLRENDPYCASICAEAAKRGHLEMLQWARANGCPWHEGTCWQAALAGRLEVLQWARANGCPWNEVACAHAALGGHLEVLQWARANGAPWDDWTCTRAASGGHLEVLPWARANGCRWNALTCLYAAKVGHLEVLQWARANGCEWDEQTCSDAAKNGHLEVLQWARANGCPWDEKTCAMAARKGHLQVLQWARANGCPWCEKTCEYAARKWQFQVLKWAIENGCPCAKETREMAENAELVDVSEAVSGDETSGDESSWVSDW